MFAVFRSCQKCREVKISIKGRLQNESWTKTPWICPRNLDLSGLLDLSGVATTDCSDLWCPEKTGHGAKMPSVGASHDSSQPQLTNTSSCLRTKTTTTDKELWHLLLENVHSWQQRCSSLLSRARLKGRHFRLVGFAPGLQEAKPRGLPPPETTR